MGTEIKTIPQEDSSTQLHIKRYSGAIDTGRRLQLTISGGTSCIQLSKEQATELAKTLLNAFDNDIYPSQ